MRKLIRFIILSCVIGILLTCEKYGLNPTINYMTYTGKSGEIGPAGGEIKITDSYSVIKGAGITIPEGALTSTILITIEDVKSLSIDGNRIIVIEFGPEGLHFNKPVKIGVPISGENNSNIAVYNYNEEEYTFQELSLIETDQQNNIAYANTEHFSLFVAASESLELPASIGTFVDSRDGHQYKWVKIGNQIWMSENLAYLPEVSHPMLDNIIALKPDYSVYEYNGTEVNAAKETGYYKNFGVLYNFLAAKTACPDGWHLPADDEWEQLAQYVSDQKGPYEKDEWVWQEVGKHLKSTSSWNRSLNGTDDFGFSGLPGGYGAGIFQFIGGLGYWWSATEYYDIFQNDYITILDSSSFAYDRVLYANGNQFSRSSPYKSIRKSVRCIKGENEFYASKPTVNTKNSINVKLSSATIKGNAFSTGSRIIEKGFYWSKTNNIPTSNDNKEIVCGTTLSYNKNISGLEPGTRYYYVAFATNQNGTSISTVKTFSTEQEGTVETFTDSRDGHEYKWVKIGVQIWMAENLAYLPIVNPPSDISDKEPRFYVYDYIGTNLCDAIATDNYNNFGVLYNLPAANTACPDGWHLPTDDEWEHLAQYVSDQKGPYIKDEYGWEEVGKHLKSTGTLNHDAGEWGGNGLWIYNSGNQGTNDYSFSGLPGGFSVDGIFYTMNHRAAWWSATWPYNRVLVCDNVRFHRWGSVSSVGNGVRCLKDLRAL